jgi:mutator protein MutT
MHIVGVSALIVQEDAVLMVMRGAASPLPDRWSLPGGKVDEGETLERALRREVREETGLRIKVGDVVAAFTTPPKSHEYVVICFRAEVTGGRLRAGDDAETAEWVPLSEISRRCVTPSLPRVLGRAGVL